MPALHSGSLDPHQETSVFPALCSRGIDQSSVSAYTFYSGFEAIPRSVPTIEGAIEIGQ
jgi:hypothetical protein